MVSLPEELQAREAAARRRVEELRARTAELAVRLEKAREDLSRLEITRETVVHFRMTTQLLNILTGINRTAAPSSGSMILVNDLYGAMPEIHTTFLGRARSIRLGRLRLIS
ncbi:hypothetical protein [Streptomyces mirabilis]|uniref:hypothetical protein n=1 Tax=Streptomyces mirabilis TaxID=68239 RepID=UPI0033D6B214